MDEPNCSTAAVPELPNEINGQSNADKEEVPMEIVKDDETSPARLVVNGFDDENEEPLTMTIEDAQNYILSKVEIYIRDPNINPLLVLKNQALDLHEKVKNKSEEFMKLNRMFDALYRDQVKFLRHIGVMSKLETQTVGVSVDLPWLPDSMPGSLREDLLKSKSDRVFMQPGSSGANAGNAARPSKRDPSGPIECIDLTDDADAPVPPTSTPSDSASQTTTPANTPTLTPASGTATPTPVNGASTPTPANGDAATTTSSGPTPTTSSGAATSAADSNENKNIIVSSSPASSNVLTPNITSISGIKQNPSQHPVPLPSVPPNQGNESEIPPKPRLKISVDKNGIVLQWDMPPESKNMKIVGFEIVGYQEKSNVPATSSLWKKIGCVSPMPLPMSCTLTQFVEGYKYHFSIRALSKDEKIGHFSDPASIMFVPETKKN